MADIAALHRELDPLRPLGAEGDDLYVLTGLADAA